jgi:hypothetical protein
MDNKDGDGGTMGRKTIRQEGEDKRKSSRKRRNDYKQNNIMKMTVFWDFAPCSLLEIYRCFRCAYCFHHQSD